MSFGGPAGQIAIMHHDLVEKKRWISESRFLHALNYCMVLPGPEAQQLATYIGWLMHRTLGGIAAGTSSYCRLSSFSWRWRGYTWHTGPFPLLPACSMASNPQW
jgi:chromate transporter